MYIATLKETSGKKSVYHHFTAKQLFDELYDRNKIDTERLFDDVDFQQKELNDIDYIRLIEEYASAYNVDVCEIKGTN